VYNFPIDFEKSINKGIGRGQNQKPFSEINIHFRENPFGGERKN